MKNRITYSMALVPIMASLALAARPLETDDAGTVEKGKSEAEISFDQCQYRPDGICQSPGFGVKHGLTDRLDLGMGFFHGTEKDADGNTIGWGVSPLEVGFKLALLKEKGPLPDISISAGFEAGSSGWGLNAIASREFSGLGLHLNLGYNGSGEAMVRGSYGFGLAAEYTLFEKLRLCGELNSELLDDMKEVLGNSGLIGGSIDLGLGSWDLGGRLFDKRGPRWQAVTGFTLGF